jgi:hypothetical protein
MHSQIRLRSPRCQVSSWIRTKRSLGDCSNWRKHCTSNMNMCRIHLVPLSETCHLKGRWNVTRISCPERRTRPCACHEGIWRNEGIVSRQYGGMRGQLYAPAALPSGSHLIGSWLVSEWVLALWRGEKSVARVRNLNTIPRRSSP